MGRWFVYILLFLIPLLIFWPIGEPIDRTILTIYVTPGIYLSDLLVIPLILIFVPLAIYKLSIYRPTLNRKFFLATLPLLVIIILAVISSPTAISPPLAGYTALRWSLAVGLYIALLSADIPVKKMMLVFLIGLAFQSLVGVAQVVNQGPLNIPGELALKITQARAAVIMVNGSPWLRGYGLTFHPNVLGGLLCVGLLLGLSFLDKPYMRFAWWIIGVGLIVSFSRSAWLAALIILPVAIIWLYHREPSMRRPLLWTLAPVSIVALVGIVSQKEQIFTRLNPFSNFSEFTSLSERGQLLVIALSSIREHLLNGIGAGNFPLLMLGYETLDPPHYVHNVPLLLAAELGIIGGAIWYWLWLGPSSAIVKFWHTTKILPVVLIMGWFAWCSISLWDSYPWALESGRLFTVTLLAWLTKECLS